MCSDTLDPGEVQICSVGCILGMSDMSRFVCIVAAGRYIGFYKKLKNVSCEYDRVKVETQLCKLRGTSDTYDFEN